MSLTASSTNTTPITGSSSQWPVISARIASAPPSASEPVSPMKICAGCALNHRKPSTAPTVVKAKRTMKSCSCPTAITPNEAIAIAAVPPARLSSPSVMPTEITVEKTTTAAITI